MTASTLRSSLAGVVIVLGLGACVGETGGPARPGGPRGSTAPGSLDDPTLFGESGVRRLTRVELRNSLLDLYGLDVTDDIEQLLPPDVGDEEATGNPFDNDYHLQSSSATLVGGLELVAARVAERVVADPDARDRVIGCSPAGPGDAACLGAMVERLGRRALRRPLEPSETAEIVDALLPHAEEAGDFLVAARLVIEVFVQHTEFLYRIELGEPTDDDPALFRLGGFEVASRLAFLMWGSVPDDALLDAAAAGELDTVDGVRAAALRLLADPRAERQIQSFHAQWLGYDGPAAPGSIEQDFRAESDALVARVTLEDASRWSDLLTADETYVTPRLAEHYGLPPVDEPTWVSSGPLRGGGLLSQAAYLGVDSLSANGATSPTFRGRNIYRRLLCGELPPPPPGVDVDVTPGSPDDCKPERYFMAEQSECASCHQRMDPIGFGLEAFDAQGRYREVEPSLPACAIEPVGEMPAGEVFTGPRQLGRIIADSGDFEACAVRQFFRFAGGRASEPSDEPAIAALEVELAESGDFVGLVLAYVGSEAFLYRTAEPTP